MRPPIPPECPPAFAQLIKDCWESEPQKRPPFSDILQRLRVMETAIPPSPQKSPTRTRNATKSHANGGENETGRKPWEIDVKEVEMGTPCVQNASSRMYLFLPSLLPPLLSSFPSPSSFPYPPSFYYVHDCIRCVSWEVPWT